MADYSMMSPRMVPTKTPKQRVQRKFMEDLTPKEPAPPAPRPAAEASAASTTSSISSAESTPEVAPSPSEPSSLLKDDSDSESCDDSASSNTASPAAKRLNTTAPGALGRPAMPKILISGLGEQQTISPPTDDALDPSSEECSESTYADLDVDIEDELEPAIVLTDENREKLRAKRTNIAKEILSTESAYVANLETIVEVRTHLRLTSSSTHPPTDSNCSRCSRVTYCKVFLEPMREAAEQGILTKEDVKNIFGNIRIILTYNQELLSNVRERVENWGDETLIGDIFVRMV